MQAEFKALIEAKSLPETSLSYVVFQHMKWFPDAIILTRVGKFYEVCLAFYEMMYNIDGTRSRTLILPLLSSPTCSPSSSPIKGTRTASSPSPASHTPTSTST